MSWKTAVGIMCIVTLVLGTYLKFFDHPPATETLNANRHLVGDFKKPSFIKAIHNSDHRGTFYNKALNRTASVDQNINRTVVDSLTENEIVDKENKSHDELLNENQKGEDIVPNTPKASEENANGGEIEVNGLRHGIKPFDWDGWVQDNAFVNIGTLWGYCGDENPPLIGKLLLFDDSGSLTLTIVFNTTFESEIQFGKAEVKVMYYDTVFYHNTFDICDMGEKFKDDFFKCPMSKGDKYYIKEQPLSKFMPSGEYSMEVSMMNEYDKVLICGVCKFII